MASSLILDLRRRWQVSRLDDNPLKEFYEEPFPSAGEMVNKLKILSLDLETTGLDSQRDTIISAGWLTLDAEHIVLGSSEHHLIKPDTAIPEESAVIHAITDDAAAQGRGLCDVVTQLLEDMRGKVLLAHNASIEQQFIHRACKHCFNGPFFIPTIDTLQLAMRRLRQRDQVPRGGELRLAALREQYQLPRYKAHNALSDALATAELLLAQLAHRGGATKTKLKHLLS